MKVKNVLLHPALPMWAAFLCLAASLPACLALAIPNLPGGMALDVAPALTRALLTLCAAGIALGCLSLARSGGKSVIIAPAATGILLNCAIAWGVFPFRSAPPPQKAAVAATGGFTSVYTSMAEDACRLEDSSDEGAYSLQACPGTHGFRLLVEDFDARMTVTVVDPGEHEHPLQLDRIVTQHFSELGNKAEWRIGKVAGRETPIALILRVYSQDASNADHYVFRNYLAVAKISPGEICVTDRIEPGPDQNERARRAADRALTSDCLGETND